MQQDGELNKRLDELLESIQVVIPVRDEESTLPGVIKRLKEQGLKHIRVVDNGSVDCSAKVAKSSGAEVVSEPVAGYGRACWTGTRNLPEKITWLLFCDGDGSDPIESLPEFLAWLPAFDFVLGDRTATAAGRNALTPLQKQGNQLATTLIRLGWGYRYRDLGPMRMLSRSAFEAMGMRDRGYGWTLEMQVKAIEMGLRIKELPIGYSPRGAGRSKISGRWAASLHAGGVILGTLTGLWLKRWR